LEATAKNVQSPNEALDTRNVALEPKKRLSARKNEHWDSPNETVGPKKGLWAIKDRFGP